ncbi:cell division protein SepF [Quadrisphaera sp. GCM10027208]|uniref:cell division protein SepF n=1 Tax=Quadrisphaera sp. GCM10027208 TaxID=3273423 RepID=UPI0036065EDF|nr:cell division protein SepF [Kineosporiaceae bacterium SCSIO 59966]
MAGALRKTMVYLGLAEEDERYESYDGHDEEQPVSDTHQDRAERPEPRRAQVTPITRDRVTRVVAEPVSDLRRITTIHPRTYNDARSIGESFRDGVPVIMNLTDMQDSDAKRLVDFSAGLVFGLRGSIERVTSKVFLLSPENIEVDGADRTGTQPSGLFNQS